jgi:hypothetical protein
LNAGGARAWPGCAQVASPRPARLVLLTWAFTAFNSVRVLSYLPTLWAIHTSGDSTQHSLWTWCIWLGANVTMAAWLYEQNGQRIDRAALVNCGNALMCLITVGLILWHRH